MSAMKIAIGSTNIQLLLRVRRCNIEKMPTIGTKQRLPYISKRFWLLIDFMGHFFSYTEHCCEILLSPLKYVLAFYKYFLLRRSPVPHQEKIWVAREIFSAVKGNDFDSSEEILITPFITLGPAPTQPSFRPFSFSFPQINLETQCATSATLYFQF